MGRVINRELAAVIATVSLAGMAMSILQPVLSLYLKSLGISASTIGLMFSLAMVGMVFGETTGGWLADKIGVRIPLGIGTLISGPLVLLFLVTSSIPFIFGIFMVWGIARAAVFGPGRGYIGGNVPLAQRATWMAIYAASMSVTRSIGSFIGGLTAEHLGYAWNFYFATGAAVAGGLLVIFALNRMPLVKPAMLPPAHTGNDPPAKAPFRSRSFISQCIIAVLCWVSVGAIGPFVPLLAVEKAGLKETEVGLLFTISALIGAFMLIPSGRLSDKANKKTIIIIGLLVSGAGMATIGLAESYIFLVAAMILQGTGTALFSPAAVALLSETVPQHWQSTAMGLYGGFEDAGVVIGSALGGILWDAYGPQATFLFTGTAASIAAAIVALVMLKNRPPRTSAAV
jgi:MFS family permease